MASTLPDIRFLLLINLPLVLRKIENAKREIRAKARISI